MALSKKEKTQIIFYLGYPAKTLIEESTHYSGIIAKRLEGLDSFIEREVKNLLSDISDVREKLIASQDIMKVKRVGDIELNNGENMLLRKDLKRLYKELGTMLDIPFKSAGGSSNMVRVCM